MKVSIIILLCVFISTFFPETILLAKEHNIRINSGKIWKDNNGVHINAHGGGIIFHGGKYYWFGEHKIAGITGNTAQVGVHVYSSENLINWIDMGVALSVSDESDSDITKGSVIERPKVLFNKKTGKFVMWFHLELKGQGYKAARTAVALSDTVTGPYRFIESMRPNARTYPVNMNETDKKVVELILKGIEVPEELQAGTKNFNSLKVFARDFPEGQMARDMTIFKDTDGKAYHLYSSEENQTMHISLLTDDYLSHTGTYIRLHPGGQNEAPAIAFNNGKYHLLTSGLSGWRPNPARQYVATQLMGPWKKLKNPTIGINPQNGLGPEKTFGGQSTFLLPVQDRPGKFIAMFDMWRPENPIDGRYIWLPVEFVADSMRIQWLDSWDPEIIR